MVTLMAAGILLAVVSCDDNGWAPPVFLPIDKVNTGLPKVDIRLPGVQEIQSRSEWLDGVQMTIYNADGSINYQGTIEMKGRGNMSWSFPKKSYALKLSKKNEVLGMPRHKRWCLISNWLDRTMMRNAVAFKISSMMPSLEYTPRGRYVELFVNGIHRGNYYLCEQIKVDRNRVDIKDLDNTAVEGPGVTGGFVFELDEYFDEVFKLRSPREQLPWMLKDPDEVNDAAYDYVCDYVANLEDALYNDVRFFRRDFAKLMDLGSFVDWWLVYELAMNREPRHPKSCYMYKDADTEEGVALLKAGPVWDFDCETFMPAVENQYTAITSLYYPRLFEDREFRLLVQQHWLQLKERGLREQVDRYIDNLSEMLQESDKINSALWPVIIPTNGDTYISFNDAVARLKSSFDKKYVWLDYIINNQITPPLP